MKSRPAFRFAFILGSLLLFLRATPLLATHAVGASLSYTHLSGNQYRMHAILYRDCLSSVPTNIYLEVRSVSCNVSLNYQMLPLPGTGTEITLFCPPVITCGYEKWEYEADVSITGQCPDWIFSYIVGGRSMAITTLSNPGGSDIYIEARLNNVNADNNSPVFTNDPIIFINNDDFHYNLGMFDTDGDSIAYRMITPRNDQNTGVLYNPGYGVLNPLSSTPPVSIDPFTGDFFMHATTIEVAVIAIEISDYRNGELMGSVLRDVLIYTVPSNNTYPTATHMNGTTQQFAYVFPGDTICFDIYSNDIDVNDTVTMTWNATIPAATFTTAGLPFPTGTFCWIPTINDVRSQPYMFTAMVQDNFCTVNNACIYSYFIYVTLDSSLVFAGIESRAMDHEFFLYPNPTEGSIHIEAPSAIASVRLYDHAGRFIRDEISGSSVFHIKEASGLYLVEVLFNDGRSLKQKIIKK